MKYLKSFNENYLLEKIYTNIDISDYDVYYQIPFEWFQKHKEFGDDYKLYLSDKFVYSYITDDNISKCLKLDLSNLDLSKPWEKETLHASLNVNDIHTKRITKFVQIMLENKPIKPISFWIDERSYLHDCYNFIEDGNHRLRALQYLKYTHFPAYVHGSHSKFVLESLK